MNIPVYQIDAFTSKLFTGNPAAVCMLQEWLEEDMMQSIATENNLSETTFVVHEEQGRRIRWFTPKAEMDLCGHATLAAAHALYHHENVQEDELQFASRSGILKVTRQEEMLTLDFPVRSNQKMPSDEVLVKGLRKHPLEIYRTGRYCLTVFDNEEEVAGLHPDFRALAGFDAVGVIATAPGHSVDFVSRFFAPAVGIDEDPVTGSAHCSLTPYWAKRLNKKQFQARQISKRGGELWCELKGDRVLLSGKAVTYLKGEIIL